MVSRDSSKTQHISRRNFVERTSQWGALFAAYQFLPLPALAESLAKDLRISQTPIVDKGFASVRKVGDGLYATISDTSKGLQTMCNGGFLVGKDAALLAMADALDDATDTIVAANGDDMAAGREAGLHAGLLDRLLLDADAMPLIPSQGSVGASGDLAPLAHLIAALMGYGWVDVAGERMPSKDALDRIGLDELQLGPKEGLALINGTQASTALGLDALFHGERVFGAAIAAGALSVDALKGSAKPFDARLSALRGQPGQIRVAAAIHDLLQGSEILVSHVKCDRVQDPYSFRCQPQVMGAALDLLDNAARTLTIEAAAVTDNPIVFADDDTAISGGNFHAQPVAFAADTIAMALCEVGSISERRVSVLVDPKMSGLPAFLTQDSGVNSGLMIPQVTAAALVSENKSLAFPASVDSIPTSAGQEDHVSMAPIAARKAGQIARNAAGVIAVELMAAAEGIDYHAPLKTSPGLQNVHAAVRSRSPHFTADRYWADEMSALQAAVLAGDIGETTVL